MFSWEREALFGSGLLRVLLNTEYGLSVTDAWLRPSVWPFATATNWSFVVPLEWSFAWPPLSVRCSPPTNGPFVSDSTAVGGGLEVNSSLSVDHSFTKTCFTDNQTSLSSRRGTARRSASRPTCCKQACRSSLLSDRNVHWPRRMLTPVSHVEYVPRSTEVSKRRDRQTDRRMDGERYITLIARRSQRNKSGRLVW